jgi:cyanophycin synthetase
MDFRKVLALRGPNIWANFPVLEVWVDLGEFKDKSSEEIPGFNERLMTWLPTMIEHRCSVGERGGFFQRLRRGTYLAHILEHVTIELQTLAGHNVGFGRARESNEEGVYKVAIEYIEEDVCREAVKVSRDLILAATRGESFDVSAAVEKLKELAQDIGLGPSTKSIVNAALARGIPYRRLNKGSLIQFGHGFKQRRILASETDRTTAISESIAQDKNLTRELLSSIGVPVPEGRPVVSAEDAWEAAEEIGVPVVVKPQDGNQGRGVTTNLSTREQVIRAYEIAYEESSCVIVEKYIPGCDYRLLVVGDQLVAAARREPANVIGDGVHSIRQLVEIVNQDPRRGEHHGTVLSKIHINDAALVVLREQGFEPDSIPPAGQRVLIRRNANLSTGGTAVDVTDKVHPDWRALAVEAARMIGLDVAGIDVVAIDIGTPCTPGTGAVVEVNAAPGLRMHLSPSDGLPRPVGEAIISTLFPEGENGRIPIVAVTGVNGKTTTTRFTAHILKGTGATVAYTCTDGIYIDDRRIDTGDCSGPQSARNVLLNPEVEMAVLETARGGILRAGLGFDKCDVAVVTNIGEGDHLGLSDIESLEKLAQVKRVIVDVVAPTGYAVLNAADEHTVAMAPKCKGKVIFFALDGQNPVIVDHRAKGGRAIFIKEHHVVLAEGLREEPLVSLDHIPLTHHGKIGFQVENSLCAIAAAWGLGISFDIIRARVESFAANLEASPGRFNVLKIRGGTVIVDYGHNASALLALIDALKNYPHTLRTCVYSTAGDRRDCDMHRQGQLLGESFDRVILYEDHYLRGRAPGEIIRLLRGGIESVPSASRRTKEIEEVAGAVKAVERALSTQRPGELLLIQADTVDETVDYLRSYLEKLATQTETESAATQAQETTEFVGIQARAR